MKTIIMGFVLLLLFYSDAFSGNPAPYTNEAYQRIDKAAKVMQSNFKYDPNLSKKDSLKKSVDLFRDIYSKAGYNYDDTIVKVIHDMRHNPEQVNNSGPYSVPTMIFVGLHFMISECDYAKVDCLKFFSSETAEAISWLSKNTEFKF